MDFLTFNRLTKPVECTLFDLSPQHRGGDRREVDSLELLFLDQRKKIISDVSCKLIDKFVDRDLKKTDEHYSYKEILSIFLDYIDIFLEFSF